MEYNVEKKPAMTFTGYVVDIDVNKGEGFARIPKLWNEIMEKNLFSGLLKHGDDLGPVGISYGYDMKTGNFKYMIGVRKDTNELLNTEKLHLDEQEYVMFKIIGPIPLALQNTIKNFHSEWLPNSEYRHNGNAEIEIYSDGDTSSNDYVSYLWATIVKK